jgi:hypothetical protein
VAKTNEAFERFKALAKHVVNAPKAEVDKLAKAEKRKRAEKAAR